MILKRRSISRIILIATLIGNFASLVLSNVLVDVATRNTDTFEDEKYDDDIDIVDLKEALRKINVSSEVQVEEDQGNYALKTSNFYQFLKDEFLTDCTFMVGPSGQVEEVRAHCVVLAAASPVLRELLKSGNSTNVIYRMPDTTAKELQHILKFVYSGESCNIEDFDQAKALFKHATMLGLRALKSVARSYILASIKPATVWNVVQLAKDTNDKALEKAAWFLIERQTLSVVKEDAFNELSEDNLVKLVSRNGLKIDEYELYEAIVKWASVKATKKKLEITPTNLRNTIGAQILKHVRFLTMTSAEFSRVYMGFKILSYDEILPIIFNINDRNSVPLPETISKSTEYRRQAVAASFLTYKAFSSCSLPNLESENAEIVHFSPKGFIITNGESITAVKLQIPMSIESRKSCCTLKEHFDILLFDTTGTNILRKSFNEVPTCKTEESEFGEMTNCNNGTKSSSISDYLIDVPLDNTIAITLQDGYFIRVEFHDNNREYPKLPSLEKATSDCSPRYTESEYGGYYGYEKQRDETQTQCALNEFVYLTYF